MDRMSPLDASFLHIERDIQQLNVGSALVFEGPAPTYDELCEVIEAKLARVPRYRQRFRRTPLELGLPVWVDDPHFRIRYHMRHSALPSPGSEAQLRTLAGRLMAQHLDLSRPLWEMWFVEGLSDGRWALVNKAHHAMIDGISGTDIMSVVLDFQPQAHPLPAVAWVPEPAPSEVQMLSSALADVVRNPVSQGRAVLGALSAPRQLVTHAVAQVAGLAQLGGKVVRPESVLNGPIGPHRRWGWARAGLADVKSVKNAFGGTVNDVILASITGGFRTFLAARGEVVDGRTIRSMVPVSVRRADQTGALGNQVSAVLADLPIGIADPVERLAAITEQLNGLKRSGMATGVEGMMSAADFVPPTLLALGARVVARFPQRTISTVTTNVPGPQQPMYLLGRAMTEMFPYIPLASDVRITIGIVSYNGRLDCGITGDYDHVPDIDVLCAGIEAATAELVAAVP